MNVYSDYFYFDSDGLAACKIDNNAAVDQIYDFLNKSNKTKDEIKLVAHSLLMKVESDSN